MEHTHNAGCASKIAASDLDAVLVRLPAVRDPAVISGLAAADDAAIYRIAPDLALVQTVDVFTPCVDDPKLFGRICAANCLSDVYAMGGEPRTALSILAFPSETLHGEIMYQMLAGAMETLAEAGVALVGGHSIKDQEIKLGFAVTGTIDPAIAAALEKPNPGDLLLLTKPLGTGVLTFAQQVGRPCPEGMAAAQNSMATLNRSAAIAMREARASGCTDVTGFGLFGHLFRLARQGGVAVKVCAPALPAFPGVLELLRDGVVPGAVERNREYVGASLETEQGIDETFLQLGFDAQTSGGLLISCPPGSLHPLKQALKARGVPVFVIGEFVPDKPAATIQLVSKLDHEQLTQIETTGHQALAMNTLPNTPQSHDGCCADVFAKPAAPQAQEIQQAFGEFMRAVQVPGALDAKSKELILLALVVHSRCALCFDNHVRKARELGITQAEMDEAAWCAISMGGAPVRMFYQQALHRVGNALS